MLRGFRSERHVTECRTNAISKNIRSNDMSQRYKQTERLCTLLAAAALAVLNACGSDTPAPPTAPDVAQTSSGPVQASDANGMRNYFAIPFAAPPTGANRWKAPQPVVKSTTTI